MVGDPAGTYEAARFDEVTAQTMAQELFQEWIREEVLCKLRDLFEMAEPRLHDRFRPAQQLRQPSAFQSCTEASLRRIKDEGSSVRFNIGHALSWAIVPSRVLLILSGKARLLGNVARTTPWPSGLAIWLAYRPYRAEGCVEVSAATGVEAWALPDSLVADLYSNEAGFRVWCNTTVFPSELAGLIDALLNQSERAPFGLLDVLAKVLPKARALEGTDDAFNALEDTQQAFISSANSSAALNHSLDVGAACPAARAPSPSGCSACRKTWWTRWAHYSKQQHGLQRGATLRFQNRLKRGRWHRPAAGPLQPRSAGRDPRVDDADRSRPCTKAWPAAGCWPN